METLPLVSSSSREAVVVALGRALHEAGAPPRRVESAMSDVASAWGLDGRFLVTPTSIQAAFGAPGDQHVSLSRVQPGNVALGRLSALEALVAGVRRGRTSPLQVTRALEAPVAQPWSHPAGVLAAALAGTASTLAFGGSPSQAAFGAPAAAAAHIVATTLGQRPHTAPLASLAGAVVATAVVVGGARLLDGPVAWPALLGGLIVLAPGYTLTAAATDVAAGDLVSGSARLTAALSTFLQLTLGMVATASAFGAWGSLAPAVPAAPAVAWAAAVASGFSFAVILQAARRDVVRVVAGAVFGHAAWVIAESTVGGLIAPVLAAAALSAGSEYASRRTGRPAALTLVPGILVLVPGGMGLGSLSSLLRDDITTGVGAALATGMAAVALATGVLIGSAVAGVSGDVTARRVARDVSA